MLARPSKCVACGQTEGVIDAHAEDYSEPFRAGVTDGFHLCFVCHMMVHCRHRNRVQWATYRQWVETGHRAAVPYRSRNWPQFSQDWLNSPIDNRLMAACEVPDWKALEEIELSQDKAAERFGTSGLPIFGR